MAQSRVQQTRKYNTGERATSGVVGELSVNTSDLQVSVVDDYKDVVDLLGVRMYSDRAVYHVNDFVIYNGHLYKCAQQTVAGNFDPSYWTKYEAKKGDTGLQGPKGDKGDPGQSIVGPQGPRGDTGAPGVIGMPVGDFKYRNPFELPTDGLISAHWDGPDRPPKPVQMQIGQGLIHTTDGHIWVYVGLAEDPVGWVDGGKIRGPAGHDGQDGRDGLNGRDGVDGKDGEAGRIARPVGDFTRDPTELPYDGLMPADWDRPGVPAADVQYQIGDALESLRTGEWWLYVTDIEDPAGWINIGMIRGPAGRDGLDGRDGRDGLNGQDGRDGIDGVDGMDGAPGIDGVDGRDGVDGVKGDKGDDAIVSKVIGYFHVNPLTLPANGFIPANWDTNSHPSIDYQMKVGEGLLHQSTGNLYIYVGPDPVGLTDLPHGWVNSGVIMGPQGLPGKDGRDGKDGHNGRDGVDGTHGIDGKDGLPGRDGRDGLNGRDGQDGAPGEVGKLRGHFNMAPTSLPTTGHIPVGFNPADGWPAHEIWMRNGEGLIDQNTGHIWIFVGDDEAGLAYLPHGWIDGGKIQGPQGIQGPAGKDGTNGKDGAVGPAGKDGAPGAQGPVGPAGAASTVPGPQGPVGPAGPKGDTGAQGATGSSATDVLRTNRVELAATGHLVEFINLPANISRITIAMRGVSRSGTDGMRLVVGTSTAGYVVTGYIGCAYYGDTGINRKVATTYFSVHGGTASAARFASGIITLVRVGANNWVFQSHSIHADATSAGIYSWATGFVDLTTSLDRVKIYPSTTNTFDAGTFTLYYE